MMISDYYAQPSCTAGRAAFIIGQYPIRTGLTSVGQPGAKTWWKRRSPGWKLKSELERRKRMAKNNLCSLGLPPLNSSSSVKTLHTVMAVMELGAGLALLCCPSATAALLVGAPLEAPAALTVGRVGGAGLLALGVACWLARNDTQSRAARGLVSAMVLYNLGAVVILGAAAGIGSQPVGIALWPVVFLHATMTIWCIVHLLRKPAPIAENVT
jgi:hypothetical protein